MAEPKELYEGFGFKILYEKDGPRRGIITTPHGDIQTPAFIFCATKGALMSTTVDDAIANKSQIILANTYHLFLKGTDVIERLGGLHKAMGCDLPMLTDSGGYQIFAMNFKDVSSDIKGTRKPVFKPTLEKVSEESAKFRSYYDKRVVELSPERSIETQMKLGADFIVAFDECTSSTITKEETSESMERSHRWEKRSLDYFLANKEKSMHTQAMYGIVQGGIYSDLRDVSCDFVNSNEFFGIAVGGCLGKSKEEMYETVRFTMSKLRKDRPVHLLGIGYIEDIFNGVRCGIDTFDCVHPTRLGRHGTALVKKEPKSRISLAIGKYKEDDKPIEDGCGCTTCKKFKRSYLHYLISARENIAFNLITNHNIYFMNKLMEDIRKGIEEDRLDEIETFYL